MADKKYARKNRHWTDEEDAQLQETWGRREVNMIAGFMKRTPKSIEKRARQLRLGSGHDADGKLSFNKLLKILKPTSAYDQVIKTLKRCGLPIVEKKYRGRTVRMIDIEKFWKWAEQNKGEINWSKVEPNILGVEPDWVAERRRVDFREYSRGQQRAWTSAEEGYLKQLVTEGKSMAEITRRLNRTANAIRYRCWCLYLPCPKQPRQTRLWTIDEVARARKMRADGYSVATIARELGRNESSVYWKMHEQGVSK